MSYGNRIQPPGTAEQAKAYAAQCQAAATGAQRDTPFHTVARAFNDLAGLHGRLDEIVDRMVGAIPSTGQNAAEPQPCGIVGALESEARNAMHRIEAMHASLQRLSEVLP